MIGDEHSGQVRPFHIQRAHHGCECLVFQSEHASCNHGVDGLLLSQQGTGSTLKSSWQKAVTISVLASSVLSGASKRVVNDWLSASFNAGDIISHGVHAWLGGVDLNDVDELLFASSQLIFPESALRFALFHDERLGVLSILDHLVDKIRLVNMWSHSWLMEHPARR